MTGLLPRLLAPGILLTCATIAAAQTGSYPNRTIEMVVSYAAGGSTDIVARAIAQKLQERLGQPVVVLNKPGASGAIGITQVARANPDGYTLYMGFTTECAVVPFVSRNARYSLDDFEPIAVTGLVPVALITPKTVGANTLAELIEDIRRAPGRYTYGGSLGSPSHIIGAWFNRLNNLDVTHVPYRGGAQAVADVIGGHVDMFYAGVAVAKSAVDAGAIKAFGLVGDARSAALPNVPTFKELGVADLDLGSWTVLMAPKGLPPDILALLRQEAALALADPKLREMFAAQGVEPSPIADAKLFLANERNKFGRVIRDLGIRME
jgi:tripartite-type tricarboxylate transporter receptor subunit TctC